MSTPYLWTIEWAPIEYGKLGEWRPIGMAMCRSEAREYVSEENKAAGTDGRYRVKKYVRYEPARATLTTKR